METHASSAPIAGAPSITARSTTATTYSAPSSSRVRLESVDVLRGIVMVLMALDHVRDYFGAAGIDPTNPAMTTVPLFFTRWITHFCAPVFFLLTGTGASLALRRRSRGELSRFLLTRGLWLLFLEVTVLRALWQFNVDYKVTLVNVIWALGWSMIVLSALVHLPTWAVGAFGVAMIALHNLFDGVQAVSFGALAPLWSMLHAPNVLFANDQHVIFAAYVLVPWVGVTAVGFALGSIYQWDAERRRAFLLRAGLALVATFLVLRTINVYGDPRPWSPQRSPVYTMLSFLNTTKYPPSLLFLCMTLGPALLVLRALDGRTPRLLRPALVYGRVPFFYYLLHIPIMHLLAVVVCYARFGAVHWMFESPSLDRFPMTQPPGWPLPLPLVYLIWVGVVLALYPLCRWFSGLRQRRSGAWLSYL